MPNKSFVSARIQASKLMSAYFLLQNFARLPRNLENSVVEKHISYAESLSWKLKSAKNRQRRKGRIFA
jgi:hypothetical protein